MVVRRTSLAAAAICMVSLLLQDHAVCAFQVSRPVTHVTPRSRLYSSLPRPSSSSPNNDNSSSYNVNKEMNWDDVKRFMVEQSKQRIGQWIGKDASELGLVSRVVDEVLGSSEKRNRNLLQEWADGAVKDAAAQRQQQQQHPQDSESLRLAIQDLVKKVQSQKLNLEDVARALNLAVLAGASIQTIISRIPLQSLFQLIQQGTKNGTHQQLIQVLMSALKERIQVKNTASATSNQQQSMSDSVYATTNAASSKDTFNLKNAVGIISDILEKQQQTKEKPRDTVREVDLFDNDFDDWDRRLQQSVRR
jgi:hypothetical protein